MAIDENTELLREMRDLLRVVAEPALAERDKRRRASLAEIVGKSKARATAVLKMDGTRNQRTIGAESGIDSGNMSRLVTSLRKKDLIASDEKPKLLISVPPSFFENLDKQNG